MRGSQVFPCGNHTIVSQLFVPLELHTGQANDAKNPQSASSTSSECLDVAKGVFSLLLLKL